MPHPEMAAREGSAFGRPRGPGAGQLETSLLGRTRLVHAADHRLGSRVARSLDAEVGAEFGGAILLECLGYTAETLPA